MKRSVTIETVMTYIYLIVVTLAIVLILISIQNADKRVLGSQKNTDIQVAFSYIDRSLRKNDTSGAISVVENPFEENMKAIKIVKEFEEHWFFSYNENFYELHNLDPTTIAMDNAQELVSGVDFNVYISETGLITYYFSDENEKTFDNLFGKYFIKTSKGV